MLINYSQSRSLRESSGAAAPTFIQGANKMNQSNTITFDNESAHWEDGTLGRDEAYAAVSTQSNALAIDDALGLQMISIRLPKDLIEAFKAIASVQGMGYQPLMRTCLQQFADGELKSMALDFIHDRNAQKNAQKKTDASQKEKATLQMAA